MACWNWEWEVFRETDRKELRKVVVSCGLGVSALEFPGCCARIYGAMLDGDTDDISTDILYWALRVPASTTRATRAARAKVQMVHAKYSRNSCPWWLAKKQPNKVPRADEREMARTIECQGRSRSFGTTITSWRLSSHEVGDSCSESPNLILLCLLRDYAASAVVQDECEDQVQKALWCEHAGDQRNRTG